MDTQLVYTISGVQHTIDSVLRKIPQIIAADPPHPQASRAAGLQLTLHDFKRDLSRLSTALKNPLFPVSCLMQLKTENSSLFRYLSFSLAASVGTLTKCEAVLKKSIKSKPQVGSKSSSMTHLPWVKKGSKEREGAEHAENVLDTMHLSLQHLSAAIIVGTNMVMW